MAISANVLAGSYPAPGRLKDGTQIMQVAFGGTGAQKLRVRYYKNTLLVEKQEPTGGDWVLVGADYLGNFRTNVAEVESNWNTTFSQLTNAKFQSLGLGNGGGPLPVLPTNEDIPYEIDADLKISFKALPTDSAAVVKDVADQTKILTQSLTGGSSNSGSSSKTRNILGYVLIGVVVVAVVVGGIVLAKKFGKKKSK